MLENKIAPNESMQYKNSMGKKVLFADDDEVSKRLVATVLSKNGFHVVTVNNGIEAVFLFENEIFDIILMDIEMPCLDGYEATSLIRLKEEKMDYRTPIIAITACALKGDREKCLAVGMDDYISKPINIEKLIAIVNNYVII